MNTSAIILSEFKIRASILLKNLNSTDTGKSNLAIKQILWSDQFKDISAIELTKIFRLKHALAIIAQEQGFDSWANLKFYCESSCHTEFSFGGGFLHLWFANYKQAKNHLSISNNEFLLPYRNQFFIANSNYIDFIGIDSTNSDWQDIAYNWVEPSDKDAWFRLNQLLIKKDK